MKIKEGFYLENESYHAYYYISEKGYCYVEYEGETKARRISEESYSNALAEKKNA